MGSQFIIPTAWLSKRWRWFRPLGTAVPESDISLVTEWEAFEASKSKVGVAELAKLIEPQFKQKQALVSSFSIGQPDFLPFGFFSLGQGRGDAVCCLFRELTQNAEIDELIEASHEPQTREFLQKYFEFQKDPVTHPNEFKAQVLHLRKPIPWATGFLVGNVIDNRFSPYLLTNYHAVPEQEMLRGLTARFRYENSSFKLLEPIKPITVEFDPNFHKGNPQLDYVLLQLKDPLTISPIPIPSNQSIPVIPRIDSTKSEALISLMEQSLQDELRQHGYAGDPVHIIQHPSGRPKEIVLFNNTFTTLYDSFLEYETDTEPGSSGSPLFNNQWELLGIHQGAIFTEDEGSPTRKVTGFLGIRLDKILADLREQGKTDTEIQHFLENYVDLKTPTNQRVFILAGDDRSKILGNSDAQLEREAMLALRDQLKSELSNLGIDAIFINGDSEAPLTNAIEQINAQRQSETQDIAIQLLVDQLDKQHEMPQGLSIYYYGNNPTRRSNAQVGLEKVEAQGLPTFGAFSDLIVSNRGLAFCRKIFAPSFVVYVGFLSNPQDRSRIQSFKRDSTQAKPLAQALAQWLHALLEPNAL
ncbi:trypsin-like peptidase domain-containing protein [Alkalinema pantanalense CENA528]|uniref:trypsin-like peptidase domain-containing protein n=1 Tax=Alkalinema pantanalense TaxID=1620705 RepID=UPI003D6DEB83